ncbi:protein of unknown function [Taphrina deformans PYCC 5710]|uniref:Uncharacterized protein n=1 Tax=Taphrina deformans (strain PYCC 5710 / ATCC 11124 / CBS 356.35 / IMI 108563 / JCM 9778 / NBRC 8474) TaxID=1097556 RepID=R4XG91_TAPDE|nr:protein of unknown function [Taphrina deformans PYCC 5710]|eukprot:CCG82404.1 protein of unknown function [Taphrina deformans PYCC 5710]
MSGEAGGISIPRDKLMNPSKQEKVDPIKDLFGLNTADFFAANVALSLALYEWPRWWLVSGTPVLTYLILLGASKGYRIVPFIPLWTLLGGLNLVYAVAETSWLLWRIFTVFVYPTIFISCLFQFQGVADFVRHHLRTILKELQFVNDKIAFFDIPALEIDTEVDGLFVVRGLTIELSSLTITVHGVEVGIKLSDDMELALAVERVTIPLFRKIDIGDVYGNIKGGQYEMQFGDLAERTDDADGDAVMNTDTPLLRAATAQADTSVPPVVQKMRDEMTEGDAPKDSSAKKAAQSMTQLSPDNEKARKQYRETISWIKESNCIMECRQSVLQQAKLLDTKFETDDEDFDNIDAADTKDRRAAICSKLHKKPSIAHPPRRSVRVTTLQNLSPPWVRNFLHRLPMLLRMLLNPLAYLHPVYIRSITAAGSGKWINELLDQEIFKNHGDRNAEVRRLHEKISAWLSDANFALELADISGLAQVPFLSSFDIICYLGFGDVMVYRTLPKELDMREVVRLGGADATFTLPSFLLPHHEHLLPPRPTRKDTEKLKQEVEDADGKPKTVRAQSELEMAEKDECNVKMGVHARLPAVLDQELLNFIAALVKATKVVEVAKEPGILDREIHNIKDLSQSINKGMKDGMKKVVVEGIMNDQWIAKMVGKITKLLETAMGDLGYTGYLPVSLEPYRPPKGSKEAENKLLA